MVSLVPYFCQGRAKGGQFCPFLWYSRFMILSTLVYVLKSRNQGDFDRVYTVFSKKYGKINFVAKGARKPLAKLSGYLERPAKASVSLTGGQTLKLTSALSDTQYLGIKGNLTSLNLALRGMDLANKLILAPEPDAEIFKLIGGFLDTEEALAKKNSLLWQKHLAYYYFIVKLITILGYGLEENKLLIDNRSAARWLLALCQEKNFQGVLKFFDSTKFPKYWEKEFKSWNSIFTKIIENIPSLE